MAIRMIVLARRIALSLIHVVVDAGRNLSSIRASLANQE
jgi:hypothetical protein